MLKVKSQDLIYFPVPNNCAVFLELDRHNDVDAAFLVYFDPMTKDVQEIRHVIARDLTPNEFDYLCEQFDYYLSNTKNDCWDVDKSLRRYRANLEE